MERLLKIDLIFTVAQKGKEYKTIRRESEKYTCNTNEQLGPVFSTVRASQRRRRPKISGATLDRGAAPESGDTGIGAAHMAGYASTRHQPMIILVILRVVLLIRPMSLLSTIVHNLKIRNFLQKKSA